MICMRCKDDKPQQFEGQRVCRECQQIKLPRVGKAAATFKPKTHKSKPKYKGSGE